MGTLLGLIALVISMVGLVRGQVGWARLTSQKMASAAAIGSVVVMASVMP